MRSDNFVKFVSNPKNGSLIILTERGSFSSMDVESGFGLSWNRWVDQSVIQPIHLQLAAAARYGVAWRKVSWERTGDGCIRRFRGIRQA